MVIRIIRADVADSSTYTYEMSPDDVPIAEVKPGESFVVETLDAYTGRNVRSQDLLDPTFSSGSCRLPGRSRCLAHSPATGWPCASTN